MRTPPAPHRRASEPGASTWASHASRNPSGSSSSDRPPCRSPDLWDGDRKEERSPYGSYWYRAVACLLLSGRVQAKYDGTPNMTDVNRVGKEANFNQYLTERIGTFLVAMGVIQFDRQNRYDAGPNLAAFWDHDDARLPAITRQAVLRLVGHQTDHPFWHPKAPEDSCLIEFLSLFFTCFGGLALVESEVGQIFDDFARLPEDDLIQAARGLGIADDRVDVAAWKKRLDARGQKALVAALYTSEWAYYAETKKRRRAGSSPARSAWPCWDSGRHPPHRNSPRSSRSSPTFPSSPVPGWPGRSSCPCSATARSSGSTRSTSSGSIGKRLAGSPSTDSPGEELREVFRELEPLPPAVADLLATKSKVGGKVGIRWCSALVKPESPEVLAAIRDHPNSRATSNRAPRPAIC